MKSPPLYFEFNRNSLRTCNENDGAEFPLERTADGRLTPACRTKLAAALKQHFRARNWPVRSQGFCAIDARGVSLRCLLLPAVAGDGLHQVVRLQIESEFPLSPDELAWGYRVLGEPLRQADGSSKQAVLVAAVKKEIIGDYAEVLATCGVTATFTLAALTRTALCPNPPTAYAVLELGPDQSELAGFDDATAAFVRVLPQGVQQLKQTGEAALAALAKAIGCQRCGTKLYIFGNDEIAAQLSRHLTNGLACEPVKIAAGEGHSPAILGLKKRVEEQGEVPLELQHSAPPAAKTFAQPALVEWGVRAGLLLLAVLLFPYLEALVMTKPLSEKVLAFQAKATAMETNVDHELSFLQNLKQSQPPYLESFYVISKAAPQGIKVDSLTMNRRGEVAFRGTMRNGDQVTDFRTKLIASGFFASVTVEEQTPTPDRQKVNVRLTALWKPIVQLQALPLGPTAAELSAKTNNAEGDPSSNPSAKPGSPPGHGPVPDMPSAKTNKAATNASVVAKTTNNPDKGETNHGQP